MSLERVFTAVSTLRKLRGGPLCTLIEGFCDWLLDRDFSNGTIRLHLVNAAHLDEYLGATHPKTTTSLSAEDIESFFIAYPTTCRHRGPLDEHLRRVRFSIHRFVQYLSENGAYDPLTEEPVYQPLLKSYLAWMGDYQNAAPGTLNVRRTSLERFCKWLGSKATAEKLPELTAEDVETFFIAYAQKAGRSARRSMQSALRTFFRFCQYKGYIHQRLDLAVPTLRTYNLSTVPRGLDEAQARKVLASVNRETHAGLRDYAILQLLYTYGVRGGQIRALRLEDVCWEKDQILFRALKHGKDSLLPLTPNVGESLLRYLQMARPSCAYPEVFLTCRAPYHPLPASNSLSEIVRRYVLAAGVDVFSKGAHAFRHGFATRKVEEGYSLKAVADVLGHRHLSTTFIYTKVDFNALKQVALDWPEEVSA